MSQYQNIPVTVARDIAHRFDKNWVVILAYSQEHNRFHVVTYGHNPTDKVADARAGEIAAVAIGCDPSKKEFNEDFRRDFDAAKMAQYKDLLMSAADALRSYQYGNAASDLAETVANKIDECLGGAHE